MAKFAYFINLDFPEIAGVFPSKTLPKLGEISRVRSPKREMEFESRRCFCFNSLESRKKLGDGFKHVFLIFNPKLGEMIQFDEQIYQMGWFNHQLQFLAHPHQLSANFITKNPEIATWNCGIWGSCKGLQQTNI